MQIKFVFGIFALSATALAAPAEYQTLADGSLGGLDIPVDPATNDPGDGPILGPGPVVPDFGGHSRGGPVVNDGNVPDTGRKGLAAGIAAGGDPGIDDGVVKPVKCPSGFSCIDSA